MDLLPAPGSFRGHVLGSSCELHVRNFHISDVRIIFTKETGCRDVSKLQKCISHQQMSNIFQEKIITSLVKRFWMFICTFEGVSAVWFWCKVELGWWCVSSAERYSSGCCSNAGSVSRQHYIAWSECTRSPVPHSLFLNLVGSVSGHSSFSIFIFLCLLAFKGNIHPFIPVFRIKI